MSVSKKIIAVVMTALMTAGVAAQSFASIPSDAVGSQYEEAIETLGAFDIMVGDAETGLFRPVESIKRSEFAKVAVKLMGLGELAESSTATTTKYPDVVEKHWATGYINVASQQNVIIGDDEKNFRPDDSITYAEAMTILVRIIGHEPAALNKGGFPLGYVSVGTQNGISKNAVAGNDDAVVRGMVAQMAFNALTVKMMEQTGFGQNEKFEVVDKTLLNDVLDITKASGQITAIGTSSISGTSNLKDDEVRIGENVYKIADKALIGVRNLLGFNVTYYVLEDENGDDILLLARANKNGNNAVSIKSQDIESVIQTEATVVEYWIDKENDKNTQKLTVVQDAKMIFNGKPIDFSTGEFKPESGKITVLDINNDDLYDLVFVTSYENYVVDEVIQTSSRVTDKYGKTSLVLDKDDKNVKFTIMKSSQVLELKELNEWNVLSVAKSKDGTILSIEVSAEAVTGKVTAISGAKRYINGEAYEIAKNYTEAININDEGTFYLDIEGKIAAVDTESVLSGNYAYAVNAGITTGFDKVLEIKLFDKNGETVILKSGEKIKLDGHTGKTPQEALAALSDGDGNFVPQLITFEKNANGVLTQIDIAEDKSGTGAINKSSFTLNAKESLSFVEASKKLGAYNVSENTVVFDIPAGKTDPVDFAIEGVKLFEDKTSYDVLVYDVGEDLTAKVIVVTNSQGIANLDGDMAVIDSIATMKNEDGDLVEQLYAYQNGEKVEFETAESGILVNGEGEELGVGDVIQIKTNAKGKIQSIRVLFEAEDKETEAETVISEDLKIVYGKVAKKFANSINVTVNGGAQANYAISDATVYELNTARETNAVKVVTPGDIPQYDELEESRVLIRIYKDAVKEIVIVK